MAFVVYEDPVLAHPAGSLGASASALSSRLQALRDVTNSKQQNRRRDAAGKAGAPAKAHPSAQQVSGGERHPCRRSLSASACDHCHTPTQVAEQKAKPRADALHGRPGGEACNAKPAPASAPLHAASVVKTPPPQLFERLPETSVDSFDSHPPHPDYRFRCRSAVFCASIGRTPLQRRRCSGVSPACDAPANRISGSPVVTLSPNGKVSRVQDTSASHTAVHAVGVRGLLSPVPALDSFDYDAKSGENANEAGGSGDAAAATACEAPAEAADTEIDDKQPDTWWECDYCSRAFASLDLASAHEEVHNPGTLTPQNPRPEASKPKPSTLNFRPCIGARGGVVVSPRRRGGDTITQHI